VIFVRLDDAGETFALEKACQQQSHGLRFEFSGQKNFSKKRKGGEKVPNPLWKAMFNDSVIVDETQAGKCASTSSFYDNRIIKTDVEYAVQRL
jgi:hypothetical protein